MASTERTPVVFQALALLLIAVLLATAKQWMLPNRSIPWKEDWSRYVEVKALESGVAVASLEEARQIVERQSHIILDARTAADYDAGHLPGAFSVPHSKIDIYLPQVLPLLTPDGPIMTYCSGLDCDESLLLSKHLLDHGFTNVTLFNAGFTAWKAAGLPVEGQR